MRLSKILLPLVAIVAMIVGPAAVLAASTPTTKTTATTPTTKTTATTPTTGTTTTPTPAPLHWNKPVRIEPAQLGGLTAVSCPTSSLCVAVDAAGNVLTSTNPGGGAWSKTTAIDPKVGLTGISCPTTSFCAAVDANGAILTSTAPTHGAAAWSKPVKIDTAIAPGGGSVGLTGISCPTPTLCVAVDGAAKGSVLVSLDPTGGARDWASAVIGTGPLTSVSCASTTLCVAAGDQHYVSTDPAGGAHAWKGTGSQLGGGVLSATDCPLVTLCVEVGYGDTSTGLATATATPTGALRRWKSVEVEADPPVPGESLLDSIACASATLCVALDGQDNAYTTTTPVGGAWSEATPIRPASAATSSAVACAPTLCVVVDSAGVATTGVVKS